MLRSVRILFGSAALCCFASSHAFLAHAQDKACASENQQMTEANENLEKTGEEYSQENPPPEDAPDVCAAGTVEWVTEEFIMKIPEFKTVRREWKMDVPEVTMHDKHFAAKEVITKCENKKTGQYPEFSCSGFKCKTTWSDIITKVCWLETRDKDVVIGVPEFTMKTRTFSYDNPEITMKDRKFSYGRPKFDMDEGCIGGDCQEKCKEIMDQRSDEYQSNFNKTMASAKTKAGESTSKYFSCQVDFLQKQKDEKLAEYDRYIYVTQATLQAMRDQKLDGAAKDQEAKLIEMQNKRKELQDSVDATINKLQEQERQTVEAMGR